MAPGESSIAPRTDSSASRFCGGTSAASDAATAVSRDAMPPFKRVSAETVTAPPDGRTRAETAALQHDRNMRSSIIPRSPDVVPGMANRCAGQIVRSERGLLGQVHSGRRPLWTVGLSPQGLSPVRAEAAPDSTEQFPKRTSPIRGTAPADRDGPWRTRARRSGRGAGGGLGDDLVDGLGLGHAGRRGLLGRPPRHPPPPRSSGASATGVAASRPRASASGASTASGSSGGSSPPSGTTSVRTVAVTSSKIAISIS